MDCFEKYLSRSRFLPNYHFLFIDFYSNSTDQKFTYE